MAVGERNEEMACVFPRLFVTCFVFMMPTVPSLSCNSNFSAASPVPPRLFLVVFWKLEMFCDLLSYCVWKCVVIFFLYFILFFSEGEFVCAGAVGWTTIFFLLRSFVTVAYPFTVFVMCVGTLLSAFSSYLSLRLSPHLPLSPVSLIQFCLTVMDLFYCWCCLTVTVPFHCYYCVTVTGRSFSNSGVKLCPSEWQTRALLVWLAPLPIQPLHINLPSQSLSLSWSAVTDNGIILTSLPYLPYHTSSFVCSM